MTTTCHGFSQEEDSESLIWDCSLELPTQQSVVGICVFITPVHMSFVQEDHEFEDSLGYIKQPYLERKTNRERKVKHFEEENIQDRLSGEEIQQSNQTNSNKADLKNTSIHILYGSAVALLDHLHILLKIFKQFFHHDIQRNWNCISLANPQTTQCV
jgi:hypothetical protein